jgi:hypothetical protein
MKPILFASLLLSACQSIGTQYIEPDATQDSALFVGGGVIIHQFDAEGCYAGRTNVTDDFRLHAGKEVVMAVENKSYSRGWRGDERFCRVVFSFVPEKNERYELLFDNTGTAPGKTLFGKATTVPVCMAGVARLDADGSKTPIAVTGLRLSQRKLTCIKALPIGQSGDARKSPKTGSPQVSPEGLPPIP